AWPAIVTVFGGQQSGRTIHFLVANRTRRLRAGASRDSYSRAIQRSNAIDDHRSRYIGEMMGKLSRRKLLTTDWQRPRTGPRRSGLAGGSLRPNPAGPRRRVRGQTLTYAS